MKITHFELYAIHLPLKKPFKVAYQTFDVMPSIILKIHMDEGITGFGEAVPDEHVTGESLVSSYELLKQLLRELIGMNPFHIESIHLKMNAFITANPSIKAAVDIACYDIMGKKTGLPIYQLIGGRTKTTLDYAKVISIGPLDEILAQSEQAVKEGYQVIKLKVGSHLTDDVNHINALREHLADNIEIRVDANQGYKDDSNVQKLQELKGISWLEQPFNAPDYKKHAHLKKMMKVPLMLDESVKNTDDFILALDYQAIDLLNVKLMKTGGIYPAMQLIHLAESHGVVCQIGSMVESSIGSAAGYHLAMAKHNVQSTELTGPLLFSKDIGDLNYEVPYVLLSDRPGLGITIDEDVLKELTIKSDTVGEFDEH